LRQAKQHIKLGIHRGQVAHAGREHFLLVGHCPFIDPQLLSLESWSRKFGQGFKWRFCSLAA
jgi:hypothetical protein